MSMTGRPPGKREHEPQPNHFQTPWHSLGIGVGAVGTPVVTSCIYPLLGISLFVTQAITLIVIFGAALFGTKTVSYRAFRLLRWLVGRPEPTAPPNDTSPNGRIAQ